MQLAGLPSRLALLRHVDMPAVAEPGEGSRAEELRLVERLEGARPTAVTGVCWRRDEAAVVNLQAGNQRAASSADISSLARKDKWGTEKHASRRQSTSENRAEMACGRSYPLQGVADAIIPTGIEPPLLTTL